MSGRRTRRRTGHGGFVLVVLLLAFGAVFAITLALEAWSPGTASRPACTVTDGDAHVRLSPEQMGNAALITGVGADMGVGHRAIVIALATAMQESSLRNLDHGDRDSLGLFQQRPSQGWGSPEQVQDPVYATRTFYARLVRVPGFEEMDLTDAAQAVQISAFPRAYAKHEPLALALHRTFAGVIPAALDCDLTDSAGLSPDVFLSELRGAHPGASASAVGGEILVRAVDERGAWGMAHWAIATAARTGVTAVRVEGHEWSRDQGWSAAPSPAATISVR